MCYGPANLPPTMHHYSNQVVEALGVGGVAGRVEEAELEGEDDAVGQLGVALKLLHVLKALEVQGQDHGQLLHTHPGQTQTNMRIHTHTHTHVVTHKLAKEKAPFTDQSHICMHNFTVPSTQMQLHKHTHRETHTHTLYIYIYEI